MDKQLEDKIEAKIKSGMKLTKSQYSYWVLYMNGTYKEEDFKGCI